MLTHNVWLTFFFAGVGWYETVEFVGQEGSHLQPQRRDSQGTYQNRTQTWYFDFTKCRSIYFPCMHRTLTACLFSLLDKFWSCWEGVGVKKDDYYMIHIPELLAIFFQLFVYPFVTDTLFKWIIQERESPQFVVMIIRGHQIIRILVLLDVWWYGCQALCEFEVPVARGVWLIKMNAAYAMAMQVYIEISVSEPTL